MLDGEHQQSQYSSEPTYRTNIDSETCRKIEEDVKKQFSEEKQSHEQVPLINEKLFVQHNELSVNNPLILESLFALKRAC